MRWASCKWAIQNSNGLQETIYTNNKSIWLKEAFVNTDKRTPG